MDNDVFLIARDVTKSYVMGKKITLPVLKGVSLSVRRGEFVAITGASGSGKSTLLHILGALDVPTSGSVRYEGHDVFALSNSERDRLRCRTFGFVYQFYHLMPDLTVLENVLMPPMILNSMLYWTRRKVQIRQYCRGVLDSVGLGHRLGHRPNELSGGECQRVAIARALANQPPILLADEPTGNLDRATGTEILQLLAGLHRKGQTIVMVTHDPAVARSADRVFRLEDGRVVS